jgi:iron(III) transport system permease protein
VRWQTRGPSLAAVAAVTLILWAFVVRPMLLTLKLSVEGPGGLLIATGRAYGRFLDFRSGMVAASVLGSIGISALSVLVAGVVGTALAVLLNRGEFPLRAMFRGLILAPLALPPFMGVAAIARLYGLGGLIPTILGTYVFHIDPNAVAVDGIAGVILVHTVTMYPYFYLPIAAALQQTDDSLEEAAESLGASVFVTWMRVLMPTLRPAVVGGALLTFMSSMGSYTAPALFGVNRVLTRQIVQATLNADQSFAAAASVVLALFSLAFLLLFRAYERRYVYWTPSKGGARRRSRRPRGSRQAVLFAAAALSTVFTMLPILMILVLSVGVDGSWREGLLPAHYSFQNVAGLIKGGRLWTPIANSLQMSAIAVAGATLVGLCAAYVVERMRLRARAVIEVAMMLPWALPGTVVAFNLIAAFNRPSAFTLGHTLVGTFAILPLAYFVRFSPLVFRSTTATLSQLDPHLAEAARSLGATSAVAFRRVVLPLLSRGIIAGGLLVFAGGIGEFVATTLLHAQERYKPLSIAIAEEYYRGNVGTAAAWGTVQMILVLAALVVSRRVGDRPDALKSNLFLGPLCGLLRFARSFIQLNKPLVSEVEVIAPRRSD